MGPDPISNTVLISVRRGIMFVQICDLYQA